MKTDSNLTRLKDYIKEMLPQAHGHQLKGITDFIGALFDKQSGCQAALARTQIRKLLVGDSPACCIIRACVRKF